MKALVLEEIDNLKIRDIPVDEKVGPNDVKIKIANVRADDRKRLGKYLKAKK